MQSPAAFAALHGLRVGCVQYLNARPLIQPYAETCEGAVLMHHPSVLAAELLAGNLDVALVPVFAALRQTDFPIVDGVCISSQGEVWSVFVAHSGDAADIRRIVLDPASLTSVNLCKVLFAERNAPIPDYLSESAAAQYPDAARLLIGNQAIEFRERHGNQFNYLDLGEAWFQLTQLPFVFAVWLMRPDLEKKAEVAAAFRAVAAQGRQDLDRIISQETTYSQEFTRKYLTQYIRFGFRDAEKAGMLRFQELLEKHRLLPSILQMPTLI
jgi:chorismate dehydratase